MRAKNNMALLAEGGPTRATTYKHCPPDGRRATALDGGLNHRLESTPPIAAPLKQSHHR